MLFEALVLLPCFWQERIQAGDLSSHLYNAWLALQIRSGSIHGLSIVPQWTNVAFDWLLTWLLANFGAGAAQRIAVALCVLIFAGGAFALVSVISGRRPWWLAPCLALLAYGFVFHIGFFNFYLSLGICLWFLAAFWNGKTVRRSAVVLLLGLAWLAHPLPAVWAAGAAAYLLIGRRMPARSQVLLLAAAIGALSAVRLLLSYRYHTVWSLQQIFTMTGADQALVYGRKYSLILAGLLLLWLVWLRRLARESGGQALLQIPAQLALLTAAGIAIIPSHIDFPQYGHALVYVADRMSLAVAVLVCALVAQARTRRAEVFALAAVCAVFFGFLYTDGSAANRREDQIQALVETKVPSGQRVVFLAGQENSRLDPLAHVMDRACLGHCFSYANYEPSTRAFRIRAARNNGIVVTTYADSYRLQHGTYKVRARDIPLYQVEPCPLQGKEYCVRELKAGDVSGDSGARN